MKLVDTSDPFYRPLWRRVAIVAVCAGWLAFELFSGSKDALFTPIAAAMFAYAAWVFLLNWRDPPPSPPSA